MTLTAKRVLSVQTPPRSRCYSPDLLQALGHARALVCAVSVCVGAGRAVRALKGAPGGLVGKLRGKKGDEQPAATQSGRLHVEVRPR